MLLVVFCCCTHSHSHTFTSLHLYLSLVGTRLHQQLTTSDSVFCFVFFLSSEAPVFSLSVCFLCVCMCSPYERNHVSVCLADRCCALSVHSVRVSFPLRVSKHSVGVVPYSPFFSCGGLVMYVSHLNIVFCSHNTTYSLFLCVKELSSFFTFLVVADLP